MEGSSLCSSLSSALSDTDPSASELRFTLLATTGRGTRRVVGSGAVSLRSLLLSADQPLEEAIKLLDTRSRPVALLWLTLDALPALVALAPHLAPPGVLLNSPYIEQKRAAHTRGNTPHAGGLAGSGLRLLSCQQARLRSVVRFQALTRGTLARRQARRDAGGFDHAVSVHMHELRLPSEHAKPEQVDSAFVSLKLFGRHLGSTSSMRGRVGRCGAQWGGGRGCRVVQR
jgi:hypothetical protein